MRENFGMWAIELHRDKSEAVKSSSIDDSDTPLLLSSSLFVSLSVSPAVTLFISVSLLVCVYLQETFEKSRTSRVKAVFSLCIRLCI